MWEKRVICNPKIKPMPPEIAGEAGADLSAIASEAQAIESTLDELEQCEEITDAKVDRVHEVKGVSEIIAARKKIAEDFYKKQGYSQARTEQHANGIDFSKEVKEKIIPKGKIVAQKQIPTGLRGYYYSEPGTPATDIGINPKGQSDLDGVVYNKLEKKYLVTRDVNVLQSIAAPLKDDWSIPDEPFQTKGGGIQYFSTETEIFKEIR